MPEPPRRPSLVLQPDTFQPPREVEHPLVPLAEVRADTLMWVQPQLMQPAYELWAAEEVVATLRYRGRFGGDALAASADGLWRFVRDAGGDGRVYLFDPERACGTLEREALDLFVLSLDDGSFYTWEPVLEGTPGQVWHVTAPSGDLVLRLRPAARPRPGLRIERPDGLPWRPVHGLLALVSQHLNLTLTKLPDAREPLCRPGGSEARPGAEA